MDECKPLLLGWVTGLADNAKVMALSGSARIFRRAMLLCSVADWSLLLGVWGALGLFAASSPSSSRAAIALPFVAFACLDAVRLAAQLLHSRLLLRLKKRDTTDSDVLESETAPTLLGFQSKSETGTAGEGTPRGVNVKLPAGITTRLTQGLWVLNVVNVVVCAVIGLMWSMAPVGAVNILVIARFTRLVLECAYLVSTLLARVDRSGYAADERWRPTGRGLHSSTFSST